MSLPDEGLLRKIAKAVYEETKNDVWLGGQSRSSYEGGPSGSPWPTSLGKNNWSNGVTWTLSPVVELGGHDLRVCVSHKQGQDYHHVRVYADNLEGYPGGLYKVQGVFFKFGWSWRIALQEAADGGLPGPVGNRTLLLVDARKKSRGVLVDHDAPPALCSMCKQALAEAEAEVAEIGGM